MIKEEVDLVFPLFEGSETGQIDKKALMDWVVCLCFSCESGLFVCISL